jgi:deazaflavin-dependent oxidoreductase (nitroreductase family)
MEEELVADGWVIRIETQGRSTGRTRAVAVGYVSDPDGSLLIAANEPTTAWARNLLADPSCRVTHRDATFDAVAEPLERADHVRVIRELILRYGTPSEDLGRGPSFRLRRVVRA